MNKNQFFSILYSVKQGGLLAILVFITYTLRSQTDTTIHINDVFHNENKEITTTSTKNITQQLQKKQDVDNISSEEGLIRKRLKLLDDYSPIDFSYNKSTKYYINKYLEKDVKLISKMIGISSYYFPMMEQQLDRFQIPLELKYLSIVESALNPKARSRSGAVGLWQFMYPTGLEYGLSVTSYMDERQDPLKSTIAACEYFVDLYSMFEDWNLVLAAYNAGPGYLKRLIAKTELNDYWDLRTHLRKETQQYVPAFIAMNYALEYADNYDIKAIESDIMNINRDTISFQKDVPYYLISEMFCVSNETINYLNPEMKSDIALKRNSIYLPNQVVMDIVLNEKSFYDYLKKVENKEILVNEIRIVYIVKKGDYLGKIARENGISIEDIRNWNSLDSDFLSIGDKLILYVPE